MRRGTKVDGLIDANDDDARNGLGHGEFVDVFESIRVGDAAEH